ncbi:MAG TPA: hypothetical protein PLD59_09110 [Tepidisphaeraceae bacterium]|nr:hypothetical protein [Tepidisphaeraceae bacterium]
MFSIRNRIAITSAVALLAAGMGCQRNNQPVAAEFNTAPIAEDDAMKHRRWTQTSAMVPNGQTVAGPTLFNREPRRGMSEYRYTYTDGGVFLGNVFMLPYRFYKIPPWREVVYPGEVITPTHTAMPPLPPSLDELPLPAPVTEPLPATQPG